MSSPKARQQKKLPITRQACNTFSGRQEKQKELEAKGNERIKGQM